jgi:hypothetical protein
MKKAEISGRQYQVPLSKTLHMDVPGMQESIISAGTSACVPLAAGFLKIVMEMKKQELLEDSEE